MIIIRAVIPGVYSLIDFTGIEADSGRLSFIPSSKCYNAGEEFIDEVLEVLLESIRKQTNNVQPMDELYRKYCTVDEQQKETTFPMSIVPLETTIEEQHSTALERFLGARAPIGIARLALSVSV